MKLKSKNRLMELAGITAPESFALDYFGMDDTVVGNDKIEGFKTLLKHADDSDEDIESIQSINKRSEMLYPGKKYYGMYAGEHMMESIDKLKDSDEIDLTSII